MATAQPVSVLDKLQDVLIVENEIQGDNGQPVKYKRLHLVVEFEGVTETIEAQITKGEGRSGYRLIQLADEVKL